MSHGYLQATFEELECGVKRNKLIYKMDEAAEPFIKYVLDNCKTEVEMWQLLEPYKNL